MSDIIRTYPPLKKYCKSTIEEYKNIINSTQYKNIINSDDYKKWKSGINYLTNRRIKIGGKTYKNIKNKFNIRINGSHFDIELLDYFNSINLDLYIKEIDNIDDVIKQINLLEKWNDYVLYSELKYGIPSVYNYIHRYKDCNGTISTRYESCSCNRCESWGGCGSSGTIYYCTKCRTEVPRIISSWKELLPNK